MVAYSFKRRFVLRIQVGLGLATPGPECPQVLPPPKRQTIRLDRRRHARPGEEVQLYCAQRTKRCFLIGRARCTDVQLIRIEFERPRRRRDRVYVGGVLRFAEHRELDAFARADGFGDWSALRLFWHDEHPGIADFEGVLISWKPLGAENETGHRVESREGRESNRQNRDQLNG